MTGGYLRIERLSIEVTDRCDRGCPWCYARATPGGRRAWDPAELVALARDAAAHGVRSLSLGGGEPLLWEPLAEVLGALRGHLLRSVTTSGDGLEERLPALAAAAPDLVHVSIHDASADTDRVIGRVRALGRAGVPAGVNLLVRASAVAAARVAWRALAAAGVGPERIVVLPLRGDPDAPTPAQVAAVSGGAPFQSTSCLLGCGPSPRFAALDAEGGAARCSHTAARRRIAAPTWAAVLEALDGLDVVPCAGRGRPRA